MASIIKSDNGVSSGITGIVQSADSSGQLALQTTTSSGTATTAVTIDNTQKVTFANAITPSTTNGIVGTTLGDNAVAGSVGEYVSSTVGTGVSIPTSGTPINITSISLTAGDWDVVGAVTFQSSSTAVVTYGRGGISTTSASLVFPYVGGYSNGSGSALIGAADLPVAVPQVRVSVSTTTTVYLCATQAFASGTTAAYGFIGARRRR
jgi:hypothetical protein